jgi:hypothetical protein
MVKAEPRTKGPACREEAQQHSIPSAPYDANAFILHSYDFVQSTPALGTPKPLYYRMPSTSLQESYLAARVIPH